MIYYRAYEKGALPPLFLAGETAAAAVWQGRRTVLLLDKVR